MCIITYYGMINELGANFIMKSTGCTIIGMILFSPRRRAEVLWQISFPQSYHPKPEMKYERTDMKSINLQHWVSCPKLYMVHGIDD